MDGKLIKYMRGGQSHRRHLMTGSLSARLALMEKRYPAVRLPMCEHCECLALWGRNELGEGVGVCAECGTVTLNPMTYGEYMLNGEG